MKVIIPVKDNKDKKYSLAEGFHNADHACIYDYTSKKYEWVMTREITDIVGEFGMELRLIGVEKVISKQMPLMALGLFVDSGIKVYQAVHENLIENIELLTKGELPYYSFETAKQFSSCSGSCGTCETDCK